MHSRLSAALILPLMVFFWLPFFLIQGMYLREKSVALTRVCLVVLRDRNSLLEFIANISFKIVSLLLGEMPVSLYVKANLLLFICVYSSRRSNEGYQQQGCAGTQAEGSPRFGCVRKHACGTLAVGPSATSSPTLFLSRAMRSPGSCCHLPSGNCF